MQTDPPRPHHRGRIAVLLSCILTVVFASVAMAQPDRRTVARDDMPATSEPRIAPDRGLDTLTDAAFEGYTLFTPLRGTDTFLLDLAGNLVHRWKSEYSPGNSVYLLPNGNLLRTARDDEGGVFRGGGIGGRVQEIAWNGDVVWDFPFNGTERMHHHDIAPMPNGNVLLIAWESKTREEAIAAGRDPELLDEGGIWPDAVYEVRPERPNGGSVVWEWHVWDHLVQDVDAEKPNYGIVADHPHRLDINWDRPKSKGEAAPQAMSDQERRRLIALGYLPADDDDGSDNRDNANDGDRRGRGGPGSRADWLHTNSIDYDAEHDLIVLSVRTTNEIWVIDHSTTSEEARTSKGGRRGRGGDLLFRYGNPAVYDCGDASDQRFFRQHDATWVDLGNGRRSLLVYNNGPGRPGGDASSVDEIPVTIPEKGLFPRLESGAFAPSDPSWTYMAPERETFYSSHISGANRLPNGNTLICEGHSGRFFEVTPGGETVWQFRNPYKATVGGRGPGGRPDHDVADDDGDNRPAGRRERRGGFDRGGRRGGGPGGPNSEFGVFRVTRIAPDHPGVATRKLPPPLPEKTPQKDL